MPLLLPRPVRRLLRGAFGSFALVALLGMGLPCPSESLSESTEIVLGRASRPRLEFVRAESRAYAPIPLGFRQTSRLAARTAFSASPRSTLAPIAPLRLSLRC